MVQFYIFYIPATMCGIYIDRRLLVRDAHTELTNRQCRQPTTPCIKKRGVQHFDTPVPRSPLFETFEKQILMFQKILKHIYIWEIVGCHGG